jgi:hypothetical protein
MDSQGGSQQRLTNHPADDREPDVSPDGNRIVFSSNRGGAYHLWVMNIDGSGATQLTDEPNSGDFFPDWQARPASYIRPAGATPVRVSLVPTFAPCTQPNREHGTPLAADSCAPPVATGRYVTFGENFRGHVRLRVVPRTQPGTGYDVAVSASLTDVRNVHDSADALVPLDLTITPQITDRRHGGLRLLTGTTAKPSYVSNPLHVRVPCTGTSEPSVGSNCSVQTTFSALSGLSGGRAVVVLDEITVYDGGDDANVETREDNVPLAAQGIFVP